MVAVPIGGEPTSRELRALLARRERDGRVCGRLLALANALDGMSRAEAARHGSPAWIGRRSGTGCAATTPRGWRGSRTGRGPGPRPGRPPRLGDGQQAALKALVLKGPGLERDGRVAWRVRDLCGLVERRFGVAYSETGLLRLLHGLDLSWRKARPVHPEADPKAQERFKKACPS